MKKKNLMHKFRKFTFLSISAGSLESVGQKTVWDKHTVTV